MKLRLSPRGRRRAFTETSDQKFKTPQQQQQQQQHNTLMYCSGPLFGTTTRMHMSCVRIENTVLYPCPALICPLEFTVLLTLFSGREGYECTKAP